MRKCFRCDVLKRLEDFKRNRTKPLGRDYECKACVSRLRKDPEARKKSNEYQRKNRKLHHVKEYHRKYREKYRRTENGQDRINDYFLKKLYGITIVEYKELFQKQNGSCAICEKSHSVLSKRLAVDHCHSTGRIRGLLCHSCNTSLGGFNESEEIIMKAVSYLKENK